MQALLVLIIALTGGKIPGNTNTQASTENTFNVFFVEDPMVLPNEDGYITVEVGSIKLDEGDCIIFERRMYMSEVVPTYKTSDYSGRPMRIKKIWLEVRSDEWGWFSMEEVERFAGQRCRVEIMTTQ